MRAIFVATVALVTVCNAAPTPDRTICDAVEAVKHVGELATVIGKVVEVRKLESGHIVINIEASYPNEAFTAFVPKGSAEQIGNAKKLEGHKVAITGRIGLYREKPEIVVSDSSQVKVQW